MGEEVKMMITDRLVQDLFMFSSILRIMGLPELSSNYERLGVQIHINPRPEATSNARQHVAELLSRTTERLVYTNGEVDSVLSAVYHHLLENLTKFSKGELY